MHFVFAEILVDKNELRLLWLLYYKIWFIPDFNNDVLKGWVINVQQCEKQKIENFKQNIVKKITWICQPEMCSWYSTERAPNTSITNLNYSTNSSICRVT